MKSFSLLAITALMMSGAAMAQTQGPSATSSSTTGTDGSQPNSTAAPASVTPTSPVSNVTSQGTASTSTESSTSATTSTSPSTSSTAASPSTSSSTTASAQSPTLIEQKVDLTTEPGPPADKRAARTEAVNALAWMKREGCRSDPSPRDCVRKAQDEYKETMARLGSGPTDSRSGGSVSASGTSDASGERAARSDRN